MKQVSFELQQASIDNIAKTFQTNTTVHNNNDYLAVNENPFQDP
jgi:hypothetical protein